MWKLVVLASVIVAVGVAASFALAGSCGHGSAGHSGHEGSTATAASTAHAQAEQSEKTAGHSHARSELHGGQITMTKAHHFESVWSADGLRVYVYTGEQAPAMVGKADGSVSFRMKDGSTKDVALVKETPAGDEAPVVYFCPMHPEVVQMEPGICTKCGSMKLFTQDRLFAAMDLSKAEPASVKAVVKIAGLQGEEKEATFTESFPGLKAAGSGDHEHEHGGGGHHH